MEQTKSYRRANRRELFEKFYKRRIKTKMNVFGLDRMLHPKYESYVYRRVDPLNFMDVRTKDWRKIRRESEWIHKYKDVHKKYKTNDWDMWDEKRKQHLERVETRRLINEGIEDYEQEVKLSK